MARLAALALLLALAVPACLAGTCVQSVLPAKQDQACSNAVPCTQHFYCVAGSCKSRLDMGTVCFSNSQCKQGLVCAGDPTLPQSCTEPAYVGQPCDEDTKPCHEDLSCHPVQKVCTGGLLGDTCVPNADVDVCQNDLDCLGGECTGVSLNQNCTIQGQDDNCALGLYCDSTSLTCFKRKTSGRCEKDAVCEYGYECVGLIESDSTSYCTKRGSRKAGEYCGSNSLVCDGALRCLNNYCSSSRMDLCATRAECSWDETCTCDGTAVALGAGRCTGYKCIGAAEAREKCMVESCGENGHEFPGSCLIKNCADQVNAFNECSAAASLLANVGLVALLGALVHTLTRQ